MRDGTFTFYTLQHRRTHTSPWLKPQGKLKPTTDKDDKEWVFSSWDVFGPTAEPWHGPASNWRPKHKKAQNETHAVWADTGYHGWWTLKYAVKGLRRVRKADANGKFDCRSSYGRREQIIRHEFRLVKVITSQETVEEYCPQA